jgi:hypothetical protein
MNMAEHERETVIVTEGGRRGGGTAIVALAVIALLVVLFLVFGRDMISGGGTTDVKADVDITAPKTGG